MADLKLCVDCIHGPNRHSSDRYCRREEARALKSPVDGEPIYYSRYHCFSERRSNRTLFGREKCGPEGRFYEEMPPLASPAPRPSR